MRSRDEMHPPVAVIILNWNAYADTARCLLSIQKSSYPAAFPVVVDNHSGDGSYERLVADFPDVEILSAGDNMGYAAGNNVGLRRAEELGARYFFVINNDTEVPPDCIGCLVDVMEADPAIGMAGPMVRDATTGRIGSLGGEIHWARAEPRHNASGEVDHGQYRGLREVGYVPGTAVMVRREMVEEIGMIPEHYFIYFEDVVWSLLAQRAGWKTVVVPAAAIVHYESATMGQNSPRKLYYHTRNNVAFVKEWVPPAHQRATWLRVRWKYLKLAIRNLLAGGVRQSRAILAGYRDGRAGTMWRTERVF